MRLSKLSLCLICLLSAIGCGQRTVNYAVQLITVSCEPSATTPSPMEGVTHFRFRVTGDNLQPRETTSQVNLGQQTIPEIPSGTNRQLEVRAYAGDPKTGGQVVSVGRSLPFDVPDVVPQDAAAANPSIAIFLRRVNSFSRPATVDKPGTCTRMRDARAGHTATLLADGRVYVAGGFQYQNRSRVAIQKAEIFNPATGDFTQAQDVGFVSPNGIATASDRAFHAAQLLDNGQVLLVGGENYNADHLAVPVNWGLVYDPDYNDYGVFSLRGARTKPQIAKDRTGHVLIVGGLDKDLKVFPTMEWYEPSAGKTLPVTDASGAPVQLPRVGHSVAAVQGGKYIVVAGGSNGTTLDDSVQFFTFDNGQFTSASQNGLRLIEKRRDAALVPFDDGNSLVMAGGLDNPNEATGTAVSSTELIKTGSSFAVSSGPAIAAARANICAAKLLDGRVVTIGGYVNDTVAGAHSDKSVEMIIPSASGTPTSLGMPPMDQDRYLHTCTTMKDGSVLVLGGVSLLSGQNTVLQDALIFTPAPLD